ncbi:hypothetical protein [Kribbella qitaiheensis]|uniref:hypothetical protein n=1 Tax=Kribbella qitaiheensis TaxID=1544730 RepID=UPI00162A9D06|nr:hypothetical protein [Kribbella qitaiheensis]
MSVPSGARKAPGTAVLAADVGFADRGLPGHQYGSPAATATLGTRVVYALNAVY